ncbi:MAG: peptidoglycan editing factor PgeF, partial [Thermomicrobiales bacterium]|nr:peptidoglycan editing factor PgeF [Thermomicrobiales bacterium]
SPPRNKADAWAMRQVWSRAIGVDAERFVTLGQVHGNTVLRARAADAGRGARPHSRQIGLGDALISNEPGVVLFSLHADCLPLLLVDPGRDGHGPAIAAVHAGWRGTVADVAGETLRAMSEAFGTRAEDVLVCVGPGVGSCCYTVGDEVLAAWSARAGADGEEAVRALPDGPAFDLGRANALLLERAGVRPGHIDWSGICTRCQEDRWFSHRAQGPTTGRFAATIEIRESMA